MLIDGFTGADWTINRRDTTTTLTIRPYVQPSDDHATALITEGARLLDITTADAEHREIELSPELFR